ncbi:hypothetical protein BD626DRAFT_568456 [Schizophyllum amplum]|uniref:Histone chaperone RTT106/FACT complex subunit SPT16-like middle domain-containing protein n=1 Tax=Schizophyllum amplum TaxID=97359 RepID=A0A550CGA2_9AGAR|nr:hypothetical protein BD626DRAFT_568456 [Auriculariopsis ampla]
MSSTQFDNIYHGLDSSVGKLRVASSGMAWKGSEGEGIVALPADDIKTTRTHFDGFAREDHDKLVTLLKNYFSVALETKEITFRGWNWGDTDFQANDLAFLVSDRVAFELPLQNVANSNIAGRTESVKPQGDEMVEIRFHVPGVQTKLKSGSASDNEQSDDEEEISAAQVFHDLIKDKAEIGQVTGDMILSFEEVLILTPRGRYDLDMFPDFLRLRGKTYDYKIIYTSISRLSSLPRTTTMCSGPQHPHPSRPDALQLPRDAVHARGGDYGRAQHERRAAGQVQRDPRKSYEKPTYEVVSNIFKGLSGKKIIGVGGFKSTAEHPGIKANLKAVQGDLFILDKHLFFVSKQPLLLDFSDIRSAIFSRIGGGTGARTFDLRIETRSGPEHTFSSIAKEEYEGVEKFLRASKLKVKSESVPDAEMLMQADLGDDDDDEDAEMRSVGSDAPPRRALDDEDSEDDEDFQASSTDEGSPSEDETSDSGAATASDASGDRDVAKVVKKKKKTKKAGVDGEGKKKAKKAKDAGSDAEDDDDGKRKDDDKPKPKPKPKLKKKAEDAMDVDDDGGAPKKPKKAKAKKDDGMDVDDQPKPKTKADDKPKAKADDKPKPRPKPKPKKKDGDEDEPPKKKRSALDAGPNRVQSMSIASPASWATLPPELLSLILEEINLDIPDMAAFCRISKRSYDVGIRTLYAYPVMGSTSLMVKLLKTIIRVPKLAKYVVYFTFDELDFELDIPALLPSFLKLAARALGRMSNLCELKAQMLPNLPAILNQHKFLRLTICSLSIAKSATSFLEAHSGTIQQLELKELYRPISETERRLKRNINFPRLVHADIPLWAAPLVLPGAPAAAICLRLPTNPFRDPGISHFAALSNVPVTTLELVIQRLKANVICAVAQHAPAIRHLKVLHDHVTSHDNVPEVDLCRCVSGFTALKCLEIRHEWEPGGAFSWNRVKSMNMSRPFDGCTRLVAH